MKQQAILPDNRKPDARLAAEIVAQATGQIPIAVRRFTTGMRHYVFEVNFSEHASVVVRFGDPQARTDIEGVIYLSNLLRPKRVPLPALLTYDVNAEFPWLMLERLPGNDLGAVISDLGDEQLAGIATQIAHVQGMVGKTGSRGLYGYAVRPEDAPHAAWSHVLNANLARLRRRIGSAGLFDVTLVDIIQAEVSSRSAELDQICRSLDMI